MKKILCFSFISFLLVLSACGEEASTPDVEAVTNDGYLSAAQEVIRSAQKELHIMQLYINPDRTTDRLLREVQKAVRRGVDVTVLLNRDSDRPNHSADALDFLNQLDVRAKAVTREGGGKLHAKMIIADRQQYLIGSTNWSASSIDHTNEVNLRIRDGQTADFYARWIEQLYKNPHSDPGFASVRKHDIQTVTGRQHQQVISDLLDGAQSRIWLGVYAFKTYFGPDGYPDSLTNQFARKLVEAKQRGVDVRVILEESNYSDFINELNEETVTWLKENGIAVRRDPYEKTSHWKLLIVDDRAMVGSMNWGYSGLEKHAEASLLCGDPQTVRSLSEYFLDLWAEEDDRNVFLESNDILIFRRQLKPAA